MNIVIVLGILVVLGALAAAGYFMLRGGHTPQAHEAQSAADAPVDREAQALDARKRMARALTVRIAVSVSLFALILLAWSMGWIKPGGLPMGK
jgi:flagellar basal body-associated protein FliL